MSSAAATPTVPTATHTGVIQYPGDGTAVLTIYSNATGGGADLFETRETLEAGELHALVARRGWVLGKFERVCVGRSVAPVARRES